jgi:hypothetical protein
MNTHNFLHVGNIAGASGEYVKAYQFLGTWSINRATMDLSVSSGCKEVFGYWNDEPFELNDFVSAILAEDRSTVLGTISRALDTEEAFYNEFRIRLPSGNIRWVGMRGQLTQNPNNFTPILNGLVFGISDGTHAAKELMLIHEVQFSPEETPASNADQDLQAIALPSHNFSASKHAVDIAHRADEKEAGQHTVALGVPSIFSPINDDQSASVKVCFRIDGFVIAMTMQPEGH